MTRFGVAIQLKKLIAVLVLAVIVGALAVTGMTMQSTDEETTQEMTTGRSLFNYAATTGNIEPVSDGIPVTPRLLEHGEWVFRGMCIGCHGVEGDGNGAVWELGELYAKEHALPRKPRDFTEAVFKLRSTPSGSLPTDRDLFISLSRGLILNNDMPAFKFLPERDRWAVVAYIKTFSDRWEEEADWQEDPIEIGEPPLPTAEIITAGKGVYELMQCEQCHGALGKGDGPSAPGLEDDSGLPIVPRDFTDSTQFVGSNEPKGVYQTFTTGLDGTPMPSFADFLDEDQRWQLVWYVISLRPDFDLESTRAMMMAEADGMLANLDTTLTEQ